MVWFGLLATFSFATAAAAAVAVPATVTTTSARSTSTLRATNAAIVIIDCVGIPALALFAGA